MTSDKTILQGCVRDLQGSLGMTHIIQDEIKRLRDENERLRAEIADLRVRLAAETGGEVVQSGWCSFCQRAGRVVIYGMTRGTTICAECAVAARQTLYLVIEQIEEER